MSEGMNHNPVGSIWHRWDPHLHAPGTLLNDQFHGDWDTYFAQIENSTPPILALGVTDYFCIHTYQEVRKRQADGRLSGVQFIFPNVEMRIDTKTADERAINVHLLFSPADPNHETQIERILGHLDFEFRETRYRCNRAELIALGKDFDPSQTDDQAAMKLGANQFKTTLKDLKALFKNELWMRDNALVAIASKSGNGPAGLQNDTAFAAMRLELERFADIIFSGREKDRRFWIGEKEGFNRSFIEEHYGGLKPCLNGSDTHDVAGTAEPAQDRFCWLKGDLTFETLRQAVVEPRGRVRIEQQPPSDIIPASVVRKVDFRGAPWMKRSSVELNDGFVAIVGARGSGKTALAEVIAMGAHAEDAGRGDASFLKRASSPVNHLSSGAVTLHWGDDATTDSTLTPGTASAQPEAVRYLSQHFVERLCSAAGLAIELREAMEHVVFESTDPLDRLETDTFKEFANRLLGPIQDKHADLQDQIEAIGDAIVQEEILKDKLASLQQQSANLTKRINSAKKEQQKLVPKGKPEHAVRLAKLETACIDAQARVETLRSRLKTIDDLDAAVQYQVDVVEPTRFARMKQKYASAQLTDEEWKVFQLRFMGNTETATDAVRQRVNGDLKRVLDEDPQNPINKATMPHAAWPLTLLKAERDKAKAAIGIDTERQKKYDEAQRKIELDERALAKLKTQVQQADGAGLRRREQIALRRGLYVQIFEQLVQEEKVLGTLYAPLKERLQGTTGALTKLAFVTERTVDLDRWCQDGEELFDLRSGDQFRGRGSIKTLADKHLAAAWRLGSAEEVATAMETFRSKLQQDLKMRPPWVDADERRAWNKNVAAWLYNTEHIKLRYGIEYDGVAIEQLSPGTRGVVLLLLYLAVDLQDQRPLIVDQPEENLDPNSVFEELVPHFP